MRTRIPKNDKRPARLLLGMILLIIMLEGVHLFLVVNSIEYGRQLGSVQDQIDQLSTDNMVLRAKVLKAQSLTTIHDKAVAQGFVPVQFIYGKEVSK